MITTTGLTRIYGKGENAVTAVNNLDIRIDDGELVAITGKSGSGKTTLLNILGGLDKATGGSVCYDDTDITKLADTALADFRLNKIGFVFQNYNLFKGIAGSQFVGMANFEFVFKMRDFSIALQNTLLLNFLDLIVGFPVPIILSIMLNEIKSTGIKRVSQTLLYLPHFLSWVIIGGMVLTIFAPTTGVVNSTLMKMNLISNNIPFLTNGVYWRVTYVLVGVWQSMGWGTILYMAAITGINQELFEAAKIDGANKMQQIWHVTLPGIRSTIVVLLILNVGQMMNIGFDRPFVIGNTMVQDYCDVISTFVYRAGIKNAQFARATAIGLFQSVVGLVMITTANFVSRRLGEEGIM